jgi:hypothetical protein
MLSQKSFVSSFERGNFKGHVREEACKPGRCLAMYALNTLFYEKDGETYIWAFAAVDEQKVLQSICDFASRDQISFDWEDANVIWQRMGEAPRSINVRDLASYLKSTVE